MRSSSAWRMVVVLSSVFMCVGLLFTFVDAQQGVPPFHSPRNPSNDCGCSRESEAIPVTSGMLAPFLPKIPNLEFGFLYSFGKNIRTGRFTADYTLPYHLSPDSVLFGEAHAEGWGFWQSPSVSVSAPDGFTTTTSTANNRIDLSFGGGYRTTLAANTFFGVNGFYDTSRLYNRWYSSGGVGLEFAATASGDDAIDLNFNWYGNLFNRDVLVNAFRNKGNSFDVEAGYSHSLFNQALDLRLKAVGYQFDIGDKVYGWRGGADLTTRDGVFNLRYEYGHDRIDGSYNTVGGFVNVGFQLENLWSGESPFMLPEPVFRSPRDLRRLLGLSVKRNWHLPEAVVLAKATPPGTCPNLQGGVYRTTAIARYEHFHTIPSIETLLTPTDTKIRFCWCNLTVGAKGLGLFLVLSDDYNYLSQHHFDMTPGTGCVDVDLFKQYYSPNRRGEININNITAGLKFDPIGGVSISKR